MVPEKAKLMFLLSWIHPEETPLQLVTVRKAICILHTRCPTSVTPQGATTPPHSCPNTAVESHWVLHLVCSRLRSFHSHKWRGKRQRNSISLTTKPFCFFQNDSGLIATCWRLWDLKWTWTFGACLNLHNFSKNLKSEPKIKFNKLLLYF